MTLNIKFEHPKKNKFFFLNNKGSGTLPPFFICVLSFFKKILSEKN